MLNVFRERRDRLKNLQMRAEAEIKNLRMCFSPDSLAGSMQMALLRAEAQQFDARLRLRIYSPEFIHKVHSRKKLKEHFQESLKNIELDRQQGDKFTQYCLSIFEDELKFAMGSMFDSRANFQRKTA